MCPAGYQWGGGKCGKFFVSILSETVGKIIRLLLN